MCNDCLFVCSWGRLLPVFCFYVNSNLWHMCVSMLLFLTLIPVKHFMNFISVKGATLNKRMMMIMMMMMIIIIFKIITN